MDNTFGVGVAVGPTYGARSIRLAPEIVGCLLDNRLKEQELLLATDQHRTAICGQT
jgi:hypothetical protein